MPVNPPRRETRVQKVSDFAKANQSVFWFIGGLLLGYALGWPV